MNESIKKKSVFFTMLFFGALIGFAPLRVITGRVIDEGGAPITGVSVLLKATSIGTSADAK